MSRVDLIGLLKIELPDATVRLCDGGFVEDWEAPGEYYRSADETFGTIGSLGSITGSVGEQISALELTLNPATSAASADLSQPGFQRSRVRFWIADFDPDTGLLVGTPGLPEYYGQIGRTSLSFDVGVRDIAMTIVSTLEKLFLRNRGNSLSPSFHKSVWPGETGHDNATGLTLSVAWGTESSPRASSAGAAYGGSYGGGGQTQQDYAF